MSNFKRSRIKEIRITRRSTADPVNDERLYNIEGIVAASNITPTPYDSTNTRMSREEWENIHGQGAAVGFLYHPEHEQDGFLSFECRLNKSDGCGEGSDLAMILEASKNSKLPVKMEGRIASFNPPKLILFKVELQEGFDYTTHNGYQHEKE